MGSKSITKTMKTYQINNSETKQKLKNQKKENALDIISISILKPTRIVQVGKY
jgi:hypothetical protein